MPIVVGVIYHAITIDRGAYGTKAAGLVWYGLHNGGMPGTTRPQALALRDASAMAT